MWFEMHSDVNVLPSLGILWLTSGSHFSSYVIGERSANLQACYV